MATTGSGSSVAAATATPQPSTSAETRDGGNRSRRRRSADFSTNSDDDDAEDDGDSDTIVISSRSRILISPRKKGSQAVSRLLGSATAGTDVAELLAAGHEVVGRQKTTKVRVVRQHHEHGDDGVGVSRQRAARKPPPASDDSEIESSLSFDAASTRKATKGGGGSMATKHTKRQASKSSKKTGQHRPAARSRSRAPPASENEDSADKSSQSDGSWANEATTQSRAAVSARKRFDDQLKAAKHSTKATAAGWKDSFNHSTRGSDLNDSMVLPATATREMEDLKRTLKNLAHQDPLLGQDEHFGASSGIYSNRTAASSQLHSLSINDDSCSSPPRRGHVAPGASTSSRRRQLRGRSTKTDAEESDGGESSTGSVSSEPRVHRHLFSTPPPTAARSRQSSTPPPTVPLMSSYRQSSYHHSPYQMPPPRSSTTTAPSTSRTSPGLLVGSTSTTSNQLDSGGLGSAVTASTQGSRAVLSALKALQEKIRRLEEEREKLMQELSDTKVRARKKEAELASAEKRFAYDLGQTKESARAAYDALRAEREELKLELVKNEERRKAMNAELQHAHKLASTNAAKADDLQSQLQLTESQKKSLYAEIEAMRLAHKQEVQDLRGEITVLQKDRDAAQDRIQILDAQFERETVNHSETRERLRETEQTIGAISQLNEKLVAKVWEANEIANKATKKSKKLQAQQRVSTLSRPTAASRAASISGPTTGTAARSASVRGSCASVKKKTTTSGTPATSSSSTRKRTSQGGGANNLDLLRAANLGLEIPFVLGTSAGRSHSIISNVQDAMRQCDTTYAAPMTNPPPAGRKSKTKGVTRKASVTSLESGAMVHQSTSDVILGERPLSSASSSSTLVGAAQLSRRESPPMATEGSRSRSPRPEPIRVPTPATSYANPMQNQIIEDLQAAVETAEAEFTTLNKKYKQLAAKVEGGAHGAAQLAPGLGPMLDELETKAKQVNRLKQVLQQAAHSTINPIRRVVHSPEAIRRKTASLRILHDYRELERESRSPRGNHASARSPPRSTSFFADEDENREDGD